MVYQARPVIVSDTFPNLKDGMISPGIVRDLMPFVEFKSLYCDDAAGAALLKEPVNLIREDGRIRLIQPSTGLDLTERMTALIDSSIASWGEVDGFIFTSSFPIIDTSSSVIDTCSGFFAARVIETFKNYPMEKEDRLWGSIRDHFLTQIFLYAAYRELHHAQKFEQFHESNRLLCMMYNPHLFKALDETDPGSTEYRSLLRRIFNRPPTVDYLVVFFQEMIPFTQHPRHFTEAIEQFVQKKITWDTCREILRHELETTEFSTQSLFHPYPEQLKRTYTR